MNAIVGVDIAKDSFEACLLDEQGQVHEASFPNLLKGIKQFERWLKQLGCGKAHVCLEATGIYGDLLAETLHKHQHPVSVVNPARIKAYAESRMQRNKTDQLDAALIAVYCRTQQPPLWTPPPAEVKALRALVRHLDDLKQEKQRARNRLESQRASSPIKAHLDEQIRVLDKQIKHTEYLIHDHINQHPDLKRCDDLLQSIPGIGTLTSSLIMAEFGDMTRFDDVRDVVAFVGLNPRQNQSGKKRSTQGISRMGRASLRAALFLPALVAKRRNPRLKAWAEQLERRGLTPKQATVAVMRKLIHLAYGILKSGRPFDPNYGCAS